jgi:XTP/dITP diphosphohydrolase
LDFQAYNLYVSSGNKHKAQEIVEIAEIVFPQTLGKWKIRAPKSAEEVANSYQGNAQIKMLALAGEIQKETFLPFAVLADDSGLEVSGLDGAPGIYSARYADPSGKNFDANIAKVLFELARFPKNSPQRDGEFRCALSLGFFDRAQDKWNLLEFSSEGKVSGQIECEVQGHTGFGYDPLFFYPPLKKRFSEMSSYEKNEISHRRNAFEAIKIKIRKPHS